MATRRFFKSVNAIRANQIHKTRFDRPKRPDWSESRRIAMEYRDATAQFRYLDVYAKQQLDKLKHEISLKARGKSVKSDLMDFLIEVEQGAEYEKRKKLEE